MQLYHATLASNVANIKAHGLDPALATGKIKAVWLHTRSKHAWAILHTQKRHNVALDQIVIIKVDVKRSDLTRRWRGLWSCAATITQIESITQATAFSDSPITQN